MKGTIVMKFDSDNVDVSIRLSDVSNAGKCVIVDSLLDGLCDNDVEEKIHLLKVLTLGTIMFGKNDNKEEVTKDESRCF